MDYTVAKMTACRPALLPEQVNESGGDAFGINSLPNELIVKVFGYLEQNQLGQIARVCRRWNMLTESPVLWKKVNVKFSPSHGCQTTVAGSFIKGLPSCASSIKFDFTKFRNWTEPLDFKELCLRLQEKCPHVEELILHNSLITNSVTSMCDISTQFLQDVKKLKYDDCKFDRDSSTVKSCGMTEIHFVTP